VASFSQGRSQKGQQQAYLNVLNHKHWHGVPPSGQLSRTALAVALPTTCIACISDARPPSTPPPLPPDVYGAISQYLGASSSRAALLAVCTAARDGVLSSCHSIQVTLSEDVGVLPKRVSLLQRARSKGLIKEAALNNVTLRLKVRHRKLGLPLRS
jgi:hypothetical protein